MASMSYEDVLTGAQRGLLMRALFGQVVTLKLHDTSSSTYSKLVEIVHDLAKEVDQRNDSRPKKDVLLTHGLIVAFAPHLWAEWTGRKIPIDTSVLDKGVKFRNSKDDMLIYLKTPDHETAEKLLQKPKALLGKLSKSPVEVVKVGRRHDGRILAGRYLDSITNPNDPIGLMEDILIDGEYKGACFGFTQKFVFNWPTILPYTSSTQNEIIGRKSDGSILSQHAEHGHIHRANVRDANGDQRKLLRQALPYGKSKKDSSREEGLMFVAFCNEQKRFEMILGNLLGDKEDVPADRLMDLVEGISGSYWYVPAAKELDITAVTGPDDVYEDPHWRVRSVNPYLFYNSRDYLHRMGRGHYVEKDPPTPRMLSLLARTFSHWRDGWVHRVHIPRLPHLLELAKSEKEKEHIKKSSLQIRKGMANQATLAHLLSSKDSAIAKETGMVRIYAKELIVGVIPDFTFGRGKEVVPYLEKEDQIRFWLRSNLNEFSAMGHVVPDYERLVQEGLGNMLGDLQKRLDKDASKTDFYAPAIASLQGVQGYLRNWADLAEEASVGAGNEEDRVNMRDVSNRLTRLIDQKPETFQDAVQLIFSFHCCLHLVGELTPFGRLDQILWPFYQKDPDPIKAQEIIDCLFVNIGENAFVDRAFIFDYRTYGTTTVNGHAGNFSQGGGINQWCQQITVGGYEAADGLARDATNEVTMLFLKAARRLPVNAPTVSLRVHKHTTTDILDEAAKGILSGGAQPIIYNDDKLCPALYAAGATPNQIGEKWSRNYAADGCYEPMLAGASEFAFNNVAPLLALEQTINNGTTYGAAGPEYLSGLKQTFRSPQAVHISTFKMLQEIFLEQLEWLTIQSYDWILQNYGNLSEVCPSPLLSSLIDGCVERGRDLTNGGARFHIIAPLFVGLSNTVDALYAIWYLVYDTPTACTTLPELLLCLINDWGFGMIEPYQDQMLGPTDAAAHGARYKELREKALALPKWGSGANDPKLREIADWLMSNCVKLANKVIRDPHPALAPQLEKIKATYGPNFEFTVTPGIGTFEGYVGDGEPCGASADGRRKGMPIASDLSPAPGPQDLPALPAFRNIYQAMKDWETTAIETGFSDASPVDMNIPENFDLGELQKFLGRYASGEVGGNLITLTCADLKTYQAASTDPEQYDLLRVRMGGWTEFYSTMFPAHQEQHQRRQYFSHTENGAM